MPRTRLPWCLLYIVQFCNLVITSERNATFTDKFFFQQQWYYNHISQIPLSHQSSVSNRLICRGLTYTRAEWACGINENSLLNLSKELLNKTSVNITNRLNNNVQRGSIELERQKKRQNCTGKHNRTIRIHVNNPCPRWSQFITKSLLKFSAHRFWN